MSALNEGAESPGDVSAGASRSQSKLDTLSRDDLLKFVKKQMLVNQKTKANCEELKKEIETLKSQKVPETPETQNSSSDEREQEHNEILQAYNASQQALEQSVSKITSLTDQVECMTQKVETLTALYQAAQNDCDLAAVRVKELSKECELWKSKCEQLTTDLDGLRTDNERLAEASNKVTEVSNTAELLAEKDTEIDRLRQEINVYKLDLERLEQEHSNVQQSSSASANCNGDIPETVDDSAEKDEKIASLMREKEELGAEATQAKEKLAEWETMMTMLQTERSDVQRDLRKLERCQERILVTIDEVLQRILQSMTDRDIVPDSLAGGENDETDAAGGNAEVSGKLNLLRSITDELTFERDEMKEKLHHLADEILQLEEKLKQREESRESLQTESEARLDELRKLRDAETELNGRVADLVAQVEELEVEKVELRTQVEQKDKKLNESADECRQLEKLRSEVDELRAQIEEKDEQLRDGKAEVEKWKSDCDEIRGRFESTTNDQASLHSQLTTSVDQLKVDNEQLSTRIEVLTSELDLARQQATTSSTDLESKFAEKCSEMDNLQQQVAEVSEANSRRTADLVEELRNSVAENDRLSSEHSTLTSRFVEVEERLKMVAEESEQLRAAKSEVDQQLKTVQEELENVEKCQEFVADQDGESKFAEKCSEVENLQQQVAEVSETNSRRIADLVEELRNSVAENDRLSSEHSTLTSRFVEVEERLNILAEESERMRAAKSEVDQQLKTVQEELENVEKRQEFVADQDGEISKFMSEIQQLKEQIQTVEDSKEALRLENAQELENRKGLEAQLSDRIAALVREIEDLKSENTEIRKQLEDKDERLANAEKKSSDIEALQAETEKAYLLVTELKAEVDSWKKSCEDIQGRLELANRESCLLEEKFSAEKNELVIEKSSLTDELKTLQSELEAARKDRHREDVSTSDLERMLSEKSSEVEELKKQVNEALSQKQQIGASLEEQTAAAAAEADALVSERATLASRIEQLEERLKNAEADVNRLNGEKTVAEQQLSSLEEKLADVEKVHEERVGHLESEIARIRADSEGQRETELMTRRHDFDSVVAELETRYKERIGELEQELIMVRTESQKLADERMAFEQEIDGLKKDLEVQMVDHQKERSEMETELSQMRSECERNVETRSKLEEQLFSCRHDFEIKLAEVEQNHKNEVDCHDAELSRLREEHQTIYDERNLLVQDLEAKRETEKSLRDLIGQLETELERLKTDLQKNSEDKLAVEKELVLCREDLDAKSSQVVDLNSHLASVNAELTNLRSELEKFALERSEMMSSRDSSIVIESPLKSASCDSLVDDSGRSYCQADIESLQKQLKDREDRENKFKQLALKAKKESAELRHKLEASEKELENLRSELSSRQADANQSLQYQCLQTEYDKLEGKYETEKQRANELESSLKKAAEELSSLRCSTVELGEEKDRLSIEIDALGREKRALENKLMDKEQEIRAEMIQREQIYHDKAEVERRLHAAQNQVKDAEDEADRTEKRLQDQIRELKEQLSMAQREAQQSNMMDLEIADYDRTVKSLNTTVAEREAKIQSLQDEMQYKDQQCTSLQKLLETAESQYTQAEEHSSKLKQLLMKTKKDLAEAKKLEGEQKTMDAQIRGKLEMLTQLTEEQKLEIANLMSENHRLSEKLQAQSENSHRTSRSLEVRVQSLEHDLELARLELSNVQTDYDNYKVRVHSVLKQQKHKSSVEMAAERDRAECQRLEKLVEQLRNQLQDFRDQMSTQTVENQLLQEEHDRLLVQFSKVVSDSEQNERMWRDRVDRLNTESSENSSRKVEAIQQLTMQNESLTQTFKEQIHIMQEEHRQTVETLRRQLDNTELEVDRLHNALRIASSAANNNNTRAASPDRDRDITPDRPSADYSARDLRVEERQSGEGSENIDDDAACVRVRAQRSMSTSSSQPSIVPFEQLLNTQLSEDPSSLKAIESEELSLRTSLAADEKQIEHLTVLLNESEATVLRLTEQASVLKGEIRRLERNQERENSISNMEYLKNIVYKFLTLKAGNERMQLLPVLTTMLKFSREENDYLNAIASGTEPADGDQAGELMGGWGSYLNRWSGLV